jgi:hypothetical protein
MGYTSVQTGPHVDTHNTTGRTALHYGIHQRTDWTTYRHTQHNRKKGPSLRDTQEYRLDHIPKEWNYENESTAVSIKENITNI